MKTAINNLYRRKYVLSAIVISIVLLYIIKLFFLQIVNHEYKDSADSNAFFHKTLYPARGTMTDRNGKLLVYNQPTYDIVYIPREVQMFDTLEFCDILDITKEYYLERIALVKNKKRNPGYSTYTMQTFMTQLNTKQASHLQEKLYKFPGFFIQNRTLRQYIYPNAGVLFGYVAEIDRRQLDSDKYYARGDYAGKSGLESYYEKTIRGIKGKEVLLRDAKGRLQGRYENGASDVAAIPGKDLTLSIDIELQAYAELLLKDKIGSIIMIEPSTGEVLCLATSPSYDPSMLLGQEFSNNYFSLEGNPMKPLYNRAIQGIYPPGSVFKPSQGAIFLQEEAVGVNSAYPCAYGYIPLGIKPKCHGHPTPIAIEGALATSCNAYFCYGLTNMLHNKKYGNVEKAFDVWNMHLDKMGFGKKTGIDLPSENAAWLPDSKFYTRVHKTSNWKAANIISIAIGQGEVTTTPIQLANFAAIIANRGYYYTPHIVKAIEGQDLDESYTVKNQTAIDASHWEIIANGMGKAVLGGTAKRASLLPEIEVCGKTGTAENPHGKDHSLFIGFAPKDKPKVAISVVVENGGFGAIFGVPIGKLMLQKYLKGSINPNDKYLEDWLVATPVLPASVYTWKRANNK